jgi:prepilin-type N-terminal cleavage/methylation domain-containing protein
MKKLKSKKGMSLAETLVTVAIFSIVLVAVTAGSTTAYRVYKRVSLKADAETLLSTTILAVSDDLYYASEVEPATDSDGFTTVSYFYNEKLNYNETFVNGTNSSGSQVVQKVYCDIDSDFSTGSTNRENAVADKTQTLGLYTELVDGKVEYEKSGCFKFTIAVYSEDGTKIDEQTAYVHSSLILE